MLDIHTLECTPEGYEIAAPLYNAVHVMWPVNAQELQRWDSYREPRKELKRWVGRLDGKPVLLGDAGHSENIFRRGRREMHMCGLEETRGTEAEREFFGWLFERVLEWNPYEVVSVIQDDQPSVLELYREWGFEARQRERVSSLDLDGFHPEDWQSALAKSADQGIELICGANMNLDDEETLKELYELAAVLFHDVPQPDAHSMDSFETYCRRIRTMPHSRKLRWYARRDGKFIGQTAIIDNQANPALSYTGLTGVRRDSRRCGVATGLKVCSLAAAKEAGVKTVFTENEENNPMFDLNVRLGFAEIRSWLHMYKTLREPTEEDLRQD